MKKVIYIILLCYCASAFAGSKLVGTWTGETRGVDAENPQASYSIVLKERSDGAIFGSYCFILQSGRKIDCSNNDDLNIHSVGEVSEDHAIVTFMPFSGSKKGQAEISLINGKLNWHVISASSADGYIGPIQITLDRVNKPLNEEVIQVKKALLYDLPSNSTPAHGYLIRGDRVKIEDISDDVRYWKILYVSKGGKSIYRWISCKDINRCS